MYAVLAVLSVWMLHGLLVLKAQIGQGVACIGASYIDEIGLNTTEHHLSDQGFKAPICHSEVQKEIARGPNLANNA
jgi:hypothetical protein